MKGQPTGAAVRRRRGGSTKTFWRKIREPLAQSRIVKSIIVSLLAWFVRLVRLTNRMGDVELLGGGRKATGACRRIEGAQCLERNHCV